MRLQAGEAAIIWRENVVPADALAEIIAVHYGLPRACPDTVAGRPHLLNGLSQRFLRESFIFPVQGEGGPLFLMADPGNADAIQAVTLALGEGPLAVLSFDEIEDLHTRHAPDLAKTERVDPGLADLAVADDVDTLQDLARGAPVVRALDSLLERAVELGATDIHIETGREDMRVRFRIDGQLRQQQALPKAMAAALISRVKILAGLDIAERRLPQDGRTHFRVGHAEADLRVAVLPTLHGENAVLRILLKDVRLFDLGRIGLSDRDRSSLETLLTSPHGILIVTGPTGSGKTTTLATAISLLNDPARKIVTVEDPIEIQLPGIHQTQIKPSIGLTFASALRSFLRHDPDIIMVGEMRDRETAAIGIQAALTGHLVLTTLHTNSASDAVVRLADMGVEPYLIAASLRGVLGQRLVRRLCERCRVPAPDAREELLEICARGNFGPPSTFDLHRPRGCPHCGGSGYRGRIGVFEVMTTDEPLQRLIRRHPDPRAILSAAKEAGMTTMLEDGLRKAARGLTSLDEVVRSTG
ncbi:GspE/PulE family protein [Methylobacterium nigriterrae]|uniref:GspE/PulE family protein n=1 Tax=Methylobacterium nigriterrae TaxID=3127512 RepID=UPI003013A3E0